MKSQEYKYKLICFALLASFHVTTTKATLATSGNVLNIKLVAQSHLKLLEFYCRIVEFHCRVFTVILLFKNGVLMSRQ
jgi:hypothetical protein